MHSAAHDAITMQITQLVCKAKQDQNKITTHAEQQKQMTQNLRPPNTTLQIQLHKSDSTTQTLQTRRSKPDPANPTQHMPPYSTLVFFSTPRKTLQLTPVMPDPIGAVFNRTNRRTKREQVANETRTSRERKRS